MSTTLYLVPCSAAKSRILTAGTPMMAKDAYTGQAFRMARFELERRKLKWAIISGLYGIIWPSTKIEAYDQKMEPCGPDTVWDDCLGMITNRQYGQLRTSEIVVLGSRTYANAAAWMLGRPVKAPLAGLSIGKMLAAIRAGDWEAKP